MQVEVDDAARCLPHPCTISQHRGVKMMTANLKNTCKKLKYYLISVDTSEIQDMFEKNETVRATRIMFTIV